MGFSNFWGKYNGVSALKCQHWYFKDTKVREWAMLKAVGSFGSNAQLLLQALLLTEITILINVR